MILKKDYLKNLEEFYTLRNKKGNYWSLNNCHSFYFYCKQQKWFLKIIEQYRIKKETSKVLDIGAGKGDFLLFLIKLGFKPQNITAVEYLPQRFDELQQKLPHIKSINADFLEIDFEDRYDLITMLAVLTSLTDNTIRYKMFEKALHLLTNNGFLILFDYFNDKEILINKYYRTLSLKKLISIIKKEGFHYYIYNKVFLNMKLLRILCKIRLEEIIPLLEKLSFLRANYHFLIVKKNEVFNTG